MKSVKHVVIIHINLICFMLSLFVSLIYCFCFDEFCNKYTISYSFLAERNGPTEIKIYYTTNINGEFNEKDINSHVINNYANVEYKESYNIYIPYNKEIVLWRIDLGNKKNNIILKDFFVSNNMLDGSLIEFNKLRFSPDLRLSGYNKGAFAFVSSGDDPFFVINHQIPFKSIFAIKNPDIIIIIILISFFVFRDLLLLCYKR